MRDVLLRLANAGAQEIGLCEEADETAIAVYHRKVPHAVALVHESQA